MNKAFQIFKRDLLRLLKNPVALVITIGVCVIPSLYAWYNIVANWDPYGNTQNIKIAVANLDAGTENEYTGAMNAGDQVIEQLEDNDQLGWTFTDADEAKEGVYRGDYYAAIIIPEDFSENLTSMLTGEFTQPELEYYVNEKKNAIAPKVTDTGASTIQEEINSTFVSTVSETLVDMMQEAGSEVRSKGSSAADGLLENVESANTALADVRTSLSSMQGTIKTAQSAAASADDTLSELQGELPALARALDESDTLLADTRSTARTFNTSLSSALTSGSIALGKVSAQANGSIGEVAAVVAKVQTSVDGQLSTAQELIDALSDVIDKVDAQDWPDNTVRLQLLADLRDQRDAMQTVHDALATQSSDISRTASAIAGASDSLDSAVQTGVDQLAGVQESMNGDVLPQLASGLDSFSSASGDLAGVIAALDPVITQARGTLDELVSTLDQAKSALSQTDSSLATVQDTLSKAATDIKALRSSEVMSALSDLLDADGDEISNFMSSPVELKTETIYPVENYGSGVAPFYTNLALWVGGFVLIAIFKLEVDPEGVGTFTAKQGYFGRWLLLVLLGFVQAAIVCIGDLVLGMQCERPVLFVLAGIWTSFVYVNIIYALSITFKHIGKALGVILVIVQIPGSSGMYPIEMMPGFYQWLHPLLPFTYGINAMRETIGGMYGASYLVNLACLGIFLVVALIVGVGLRPFFLNLNILFDRQLASTGVMICEQNALPNRRYSLRTAMRAVLDTKGFREALIVRAAKFEHTYPRRVRAGFCMVFGLPILLFVLTWLLDLSNDGKIVMLVLWILAVILADAYLIDIEYVRESLNTQMRVTALSDEGLLDEVRRHTVAFPAAAKMFGVQVAGGSADADAAEGEAAPAPEAPAPSDAAAPKGGDLDA